MIFNLNEYLIAVSFALDFVEMDIFGIATNHSKRVAYIALKIGERMGLSKEALFDLVSLAILHDNGACEKVLEDESSRDKRESFHTVESTLEHGIKGEENVKDYPFITNVADVIKYHHENYDGSGFFGIKGAEIPVMAQIIKLADTIELGFPLGNMFYEDKQKLRDFVNRQTGILFSPRPVEILQELSGQQYFWLELKDESVSGALKKRVPYFATEMSFEKIRRVTQVFSKIIDSKSAFTREHSCGLTKKAAKMGEFYKKPQEEIYKLMITGDLHDIGKLTISNDILDKPGALNRHEVDIIQQHTFYTRLSLQEIQGFEDITEWAANHHEKLNGRGYPYGKNERELDFNSRLMACLDIYQALCEERPYRKPMRHEDAAGILRNMAAEGSLDGKIVEDVIGVFSDNR